MKLRIFKSVTLNDGRLLEYREWPAYRYFRLFRAWFWLPQFIIRPLCSYALQRRIDGGGWKFFIKTVGQ